VERGPPRLADPREFRSSRRVKNCERKSPEGQTTPSAGRSNLSQWTVKAASRRLRLKAGLRRDYPGNGAQRLPLSMVCSPFREHNAGLRLRVAGLTASGEPATDEHKNPTSQPHGGLVQRYTSMSSALGFVSTPDESHQSSTWPEHWWQNDEMKEMLDQGLDPVIARDDSILPAVTKRNCGQTPRRFHLQRTCCRAGNVSGRYQTGRDRRWPFDRSVADRSCCLGPYVLSNSGSGRRGNAPVDRRMQTKGNPKQVMEELARRNLIRHTPRRVTLAPCCLTRCLRCPNYSGGSGGRFSTMRQSHRY